VPGWGKLVAGAVLGVAGALYATNEEFRKALPEKVRNLPVTVQRRFEEAAAAAREASALRRAEILRELQTHGDHAGRGIPEATQFTPPRRVPTSRSAEEPAAREESV
jgi:hypothetical protein